MSNIKKEGINPDTTIWCSNDYLNMSHNPRVIERMIEVIKEVGTGSGGTRNIFLELRPTMTSLKKNWLPITSERLLLFLLLHM